MTFKYSIGIQREELPQDFKDEAAKLAFKMGEALEKIIDEEKNLNLSLCALQWMFTAMCANFFDNDPEVLRGLAISLAKNVIDNMEVIIKSREKENSKK